MNEETQATSEATGDLNDIDVSDIDFGAADTDTEESIETTEETAPETDEADQPTQTESEAEKVETETEETKEADQFTLKHLDEVKTVSRDEIIPLAQKGLDYDRIRQKLDDISAEKAKADETLSFFKELAQQQGLTDVDALIDETRASLMSQKTGIDIETARQRVAVEREKREVAAEKARIANERTAKDTKAEAAKKAEDKRQNDIKTFIEEYPGIKPTDIPKEVWDKVNKGDSLLSAYRAYENRELRKQLEAEKKNAENKQRTTGSRSTAGNTTASDPWLADLESRI